MTPAGVAPAPTAPSERIEILDVLRGFALFGVLLVNVQFFAHPSWSALLASGDATAADRLGVWIVVAFGQSKFYPLFSFLFGYGMALQMQNAAARGTSFVPLYAWRLAILLLIGMYHEYFLWDGDILATYALLGYVLITFRNRSDRTLLATSAACLMAVALALVALRTALGLSWLTPETAAAFEQRFAESADTARHAARQGFRVMAMFLFGLYAGRAQIFRERSRYAGALPRVLALCLPLGLAGNLGYAALVEGLDPARLSWAWVLSVALLAVAGPTLGAGYVALLLTLDARPFWHRQLARMAGLGRTALTNYLMQTLVLLALSRGLGLSIRPLAGVALTGAVFAAQVWLSNRWLRHFRYGPVEWLWRSLTYGRAVPLRERVSSGGAGAEG